MSIPPQTPPPHVAPQSLPYFSLSAGSVAVASEQRLGYIDVAFFRGGTNAFGTSVGG